VKISVKAEESVYSDRYSNNGSCPLWCFNNTCVVRVGEDLFASGYERIPDAPPMNDCRWVLRQRTEDSWQLPWPAYAPTDMAPFGASHARVNYPVVALNDRTVHFCGAADMTHRERTDLHGNIKQENI
jgi:hypothetical protein